MTLVWVLFTAILRNSTKTRNFKKEINLQPKRAFTNFNKSTKQIISSDWNLIEQNLNRQNMIKD